MLDDEIRYPWPEPWAQQLHTTLTQLYPSRPRMTAVAQRAGSEMVDEPSPWRSLAMLASVGITFVVATAGATIGGYFLDRWLGTTPWLTLVGLVVGVAGVVLEIVLASIVVGGIERLL